MTNSKKRLRVVGFVLEQKWIYVAILVFQIGFLLDLFCLGLVFFFFSFFNWFGLVVGLVLDFWFFGFFFTVWRSSFSLLVFLFVCFVFILVVVIDVWLVF